MEKLLLSFGVVFRVLVVNANSARVKQLVRAGDLDKLESFVIQGQGAKLLGEFSSDFKIRKFIRNQVPAIMVSQYIFIIFLYFINSLKNGDLSIIILLLYLRSSNLN